MPTCYYCENRATVVFNDDKLACADCKDERLDDDSRLETENDLWWPLKTTVAIAA
jgi:hypothetical protein